MALLLPGSGQQKLRRMNLPFSVNPDKSLEEEINKLLGEASFRRL